MSNNARAQTGHLQQLYMAVWPGMRVSDMVATGEYPQVPKQPVQGWQVIAVRFMFPELHDISALVEASTHVDPETPRPGETQ